MNHIWQAGEIKEFNNHEEAKDWVTKESKFWLENRLKKEEVKTFEKFLGDNPNSVLLRDQVEIYLRTQRGNLLSKDNPQYREYENENHVKLDKLNQVIKHLDAALERTKLSNGIVLYHVFSTDGIAFIGHDFWAIYNDANPQKIDLTKFEKVAARWKDSNRTLLNFLNGSLLKPTFWSGHISVPAFIKFIVPKGHMGGFYPTNHTINRDNVKMILPRNAKFKVNDLKIVIDNEGRELIQIDAQLQN